MSYNCDHIMKHLVLSLKIIIKILNNKDIWKQVI